MSYKKLADDEYEEKVKLWVTDNVAIVVIAPKEQEVTRRDLHRYAWAAAKHFKKTIRR